MNKYESKGIFLYVFASGCGCSLYVWFGICSRNFELKRVYNRRLQYTATNLRYMITVSFRVDNETFSFRIDSVFVGYNNKCVLHFPVDHNKGELYKFSLGYNLELYKYTDGHIGLTIDLDSIYSLKYDKEG